MQDSNGSSEEDFNESFVELFKSDKQDNPILTRTRDLRTRTVQVEVQLSSKTKPTPKKKEIDKTPKMSFDADFALKMIPEFGGKSNELHKFLTLCEDMYSTIKTPASTEDEQKFLFVVKRKLVDNAYDEVVKFKSYANWSKMKKALKLSFSEQRSVAQIQTELIKISQNKTEDVRTYASRVQKLLALLDNACIESEGEDSAKVVQNINQKTALKAFQEGLKDPIKLIVKACRFEKLKDAIMQACEEEVSVKINQSNQSEATRCQICRKPGHSSAVCFQRYSQNNNNNNSSRQPSQTANNQSSSQTNVRTFNVICSYCKNKGHHISQCRKRQWNNQHKNNSSQGSSINQSSENQKGPAHKNSNPNQTTSKENAAVRAQELP